MQHLLALPAVIKLSIAVYVKQLHALIVIHSLLDILEYLVYKISISMENLLIKEELALNALELKAVQRQ
jgi:hypothetical protein